MSTLIKAPNNIKPSLEGYFLLFIQGDEKGVSYIYNRLFPRLFNYSYAIIKNKFEISSIIHNAFLNAWMHKENMNNMLHLQRYLFLSVKWGCYKYLNSNYHRKHSSYLPYDSLISRQIDDSLEEYDVKYESKELLTLIQSAIPYLKLNRKMVMKLAVCGLSHRQINEAASSKYKNFTDEFCLKMKVLKSITKRIKKIETANERKSALSELGIQDYLNPLQRKIFHRYYESKYSLNKIAEELNISPLKALQQHFYIIRLSEKLKKKLSHS